MLVRHLALSCFALLFTSGFRPHSFFPFVIELPVLDDVYLCYAPSFYLQKSLHAQLLFCLGVLGYTISIQVDEWSHHPYPFLYPLFNLAMILLC